MKRILIIGWGAISQRHHRNLRELLPRAQFALMRSGVESPTPRGMIRIETMKTAMEWNPQGVVVASPAPLHLKTSETFLKVGIPVYLEKPLAAEKREGIRFARRWKNAPLVLGYNFRFYRPFLAIERAIRSKKIGQIISADFRVGQYLPDWRPGQSVQQMISARKETGGGALLELSHEIDTALWWLGEAVEVGGWMGRLSAWRLPVEDWVEMLIRFRSGTRARIHMDFMDRQANRSLRLIGEKGTIGWEMCDHVAWVDLGSGKRHLDSGKKLDRNAMYMEAMRHWIQVSRGKEKARCDAEAGARVLRLIGDFRNVAGGKS